MKQEQKKEQIQDKQGNKLSEKRSWSKKKKQTVAGALVTSLLLMGVPVLAWLYYQRSLETATRIQEPNALLIGEGDQQEIWKMDLGNIDVNQKQPYKDIVFCVYGFEKLSYQLELAHTTNIGFEYQIYKAAKSGDGTVTDSEGVKYIQNGAVDGKYLNLSSEMGTKKTAKSSDVYHDKTYVKLDGSVGQAYENVQTYAEPLYWKNTENLTLPSEKSATGVYIDYYILHISWDNTFQNNKETDMVYLMAERTTMSE